MPGKPNDYPIPEKPDDGAEGVVNNDSSPVPKKTFDLFLLKRFCRVMCHRRRRRRRRRRCRRRCRLFTSITFAFEG